MRIAAVVLIGCSSGTKAPDPPACEATITGAFERIAKNDKLDAAERMKQTMIASCESEQWSPDALTCIASARLAVDLTACTEKLTYEQHERLAKKLATLHPDAGVQDAAPPRDASVDTPLVDAAVRFEAPPPIDAGIDCSKSIVDPHDRACIRGYCAKHKDDMRCDIE